VAFMTREIRCTSIGDLGGRFVFNFRRSREPLAPGRFYQATSNRGLAEKHPLGCSLTFSGHRLLVLLHNVRRSGN